MPLLRLAGQCAPARSILRILAAHQDWPASLDHHGAQPGGLITHTTRAVTLALAHPGAHDPRLRTAFLLTVLAHDVGKVIAYEKHPAGRYVYRSYYHANKSADVLVAAGVYHAFSRDLAEAILIALRCSAGKALTPVPENTPVEAKTLLHWLTEVDHAAVEQDVEDLKQVVEHADYPALLTAVLAAPAPVVDLPPPLYTAGGSPYLIRDPARMVLVHLLGLEAHPGVHATVGRRDPVWDKLKAVLKETGASTGKEEKIEIPGITKPLSGVPLSGAFLKEHGV